MYEVKQPPYLQTGHNIQIYTVKFSLNIILTIREWSLHYIVYYFKF